MSTFNLNQSIRLKKQYGGHGWLCPDGSFHPCDSESCVTHAERPGLWGHERAAITLLESHPDLLNELEAEIADAGYESIDDTNGDDVVRRFMVKKGFIEV